MKLTSKLLVALPFSMLALGTPVQAAFVGYDANAPTSNFGAPTAFNNTVAYNTSVSSDSTYLHLNVTADPNAGGAYNSGLFFANLYLSTAGGGSTVGFEVNNFRSFVPGGPGYYNTADDGFIVTLNQAAGVIDVLIPWTYLTSDPDNMGFTKIDGVNNKVVLRISQSFSYSAAGGASYGTDRLGSAEYSGAAVPEPSTYIAGALLLLPFGASMMRKLRKA